MLCDYLIRKEWGSCAPHEFMGSFRLENDLSWTSTDQLAEKNKQNEWAQKLLDSTTKSASFLAIESGDFSMEQS